MSSLGRTVDVRGFWQVQYLSALLLCRYHPHWTKGVPDMQRRSIDDALRLVCLLPPRDTRRPDRKVRAIVWSCEAIVALVIVGVQAASCVRA